MNQDVLRVSLLPLEAKKERLGCMDRVYEERGMHRMLFDQIQPGDMRDRGFQKPEYSLAVLLRVCESRGGILHTHVDHIQAQRVSGEAPHCEILFQVIF